jgi:glutamine synthetase
MAKPANDFIDGLRARDVAFVEFRFTDAFGRRRGASVPATNVDARALESGILVDDILLVPDLETARLDATRAESTVMLLCAARATEAAAAPDDPRAVARRAEARLRASGLADVTTFATDVACTLRTGSARDRRPERAAAERTRDAIACALAAAGVEVVAFALDGDDRVRFELREAPLCAAADAVAAAKDIARRVAAERDLAATFMPLPDVHSDGVGLTLAVGALKDGRSVFYDADGYAACSQTLLHVIGGVLAHLDAVLAFAAPTANSYRRFAALATPLAAGFSARNPATAIGIAPASAREPRARRFAFRAADATADPYLAFAALACAGLDGTARALDPIKAGFGPLEASDAAPRRTLARDLEAALEALAADRDFLVAGDVFEADFVARWIARKRERELATLARRPHPDERDLYFDA